jgi:hypothetical protein
LLFQLCAFACAATAACIASSPWWMFT